MIESISAEGPVSDTSPASSADLQSRLKRVLSILPRGSCRPSMSLIILVLTVRAARGRTVRVVVRLLRQMWPREARRPSFGGGGYEADGPHEDQADSEECGDLVGGGETAAADDPSLR